MVVGSGLLFFVLAIGLKTLGRGKREDQCDEIRLENDGLLEIARYLRAHLFSLLLLHRCLLVGIEIRVASTSTCLGFGS